MPACRESNQWAHPSSSDQGQVHGVNVFGHLDSPWSNPFTPSAEIKYGKATEKNVKVKEEGGV